MDDYSFDHLTRNLVPSASDDYLGRRSALKGVIGAGLAALLVRLGWVDVEARKRRHKRKRKKNRGTAGTSPPPPPPPPPRPQPPPSCDVDEDSAAGLTCCDPPAGDCVDLLNDSFNCGTCGTTCFELIAGGACVHGGCTTLCQTDDQCGLAPCQQCLTTARSATTRLCANSNVQCNPPTTCMVDEDCAAGEGCFVDGCPGVTGGVCVGTSCAP